MVVWVVASVLCAVLFVAWASAASRTRRVRRRDASRRPGHGAFAESLGRDPNDAIAIATYEALLRVGGHELVVIRADDDIERDYGISDEDIDELVIAAAERSAGVGKDRLIGCHGRIRTPRELVALLERLQSTEPSDPA